MSYTLSCSGQTATFDEWGRLTMLHDPLGSGNVLAEPSPFVFKVALELGECKETMGYDWGQEAPEASRCGDCLTYRYRGLWVTDGSRKHRLDVELTLTVTSKCGELLFDCQVSNHSEARILEVAYPCVGKLRSLGEGRPMSLLFPRQCGQRIQHVGRYLGEGYHSRENGSCSIGGTYPGGVSMGWMALTDQRRTLALRTEDSQFYPTELRVQGEHGKDTVSLWMSRFICLKGGQGMRLGRTVLSFCRGDWHAAADAYVSWIAPYRPRHERPAWVSSAAGYFLVISKQQYGYEMWPYRSLPRLYELAQAHGFDTVGLFGWYQSGHDNQYPDLEVSSSMGGEEELKRGIRGIQASGGHVTLYYQGHLIDETSPFYRHGAGPQVAMKNIWGSPYVEFYNKSHENDFLKEFSRKMFTLACPSSAIWHDLMLEREGWLASLGADGCLYDQIGGMPPYLCFAEGHQHDDDNPALATSHGRLRLLRDLQAHSKELGREFAFLSEHIVDIYSAHLDLVHGIMTYPGKEGCHGAARRSPETPCLLPYPSLFRYCFPETMITVRNPAPYLEPRLMNYALLYGFLPEMELRYQADCTEVEADAYGAWREYARKVIALRERYAEFLKSGSFHDDRDVRSGRSVIASCPDTVLRSVFASGDRMAVVLWNDCPESVSLGRFELVSGWRLVECGTVAGRLSSLPAEMPGASVMVLVCECAD